MMNCACGDKKCKSKIVWDTGSHALRAIRGYDDRENIEEVLIHYDANALIELIREARVALIALAEEEVK